MARKLGTESWKLRAKNWKEWRENGMGSDTKNCQGM